MGLWASSSALVPDFYDVYSHHPLLPSRLSLRGQGGQGVAGDLHPLPLRFHDSSQLVIEVDRWSIPIENAPFKARAALGYGVGGDASEERFAYSLPAMFGADV